MELPDQPANMQTWQAYVAYHNTLVQTRFSSAALYMTAAAFLVAANFSRDLKEWSGFPLLIPLLGVVITLSALLLEVRTEALLANVIARGMRLENRLGMGEEQSFFHFCFKPQTLGVRIPLLRWRIPNQSRFSRYFLSHSFALELMYLSFLGFWLNAGWVAVG